MVKCYYVNNKGVVKKFVFCNVLNLRPLSPKILNKKQMLKKRPSDETGYRTLSISLADFDHRIRCDHHAAPSLIRGSLFRKQELYS